MKHPKLWKSIQKEVYSEPFQTSNRVFIKIKIVLTIFTKSSISDVYQDSEFASELSNEYNFTINNSNQKLFISVQTEYNKNKI